MIYILTTLLFLFSQNSFSKTFECDDSSKLPMLVEGCEGEACSYIKQKKAKMDIPLYDKPNLKSKKIGLIKKCEAFKNAKVFMYMKKFQNAPVTRSIKELKKLGVKEGDLVPIYKWDIAGALYVCINDKKILVAKFNETDKPALHLSEIDLRKVKFQLHEQWVELTDKNGNTGYAPKSSKTISWYGSSTLDPIECLPKK